MEFFDIIKEKLISYNITYEQIYLDTKLYHQYVKYRETLSKKIKEVNERLKEVEEFVHVFNDKLPWKVDESKQINYLLNLQRELTDDLTYITEKIKTLNVNQQIYTQYMLNLQLINSY
jgi:ATP-dependent Lon protease